MALSAASTRSIRMTCKSTFRTYALRNSNTALARPVAGGKRLSLGGGLGNSHVFSGFTDTCRNLCRIPKRGRSNLTLVGHRRAVGYQGDLAWYCLLQGRIQMLFDRLLEKQCH